MPPLARAGGTAPWAGLPPERLRPTVDDVVAALAAAGDPHPSPVERFGFDGVPMPDMVRDVLAGAVARPSAVLAALYEHDGRAWVVLTRRAWHLRSHKGEVSFPGGRQEDADADLVATALREAHEEVGLDPATVRVVGELDHLSTISSRSFIVPYVGVLPGRPDLTAAPHEVDAVLHVPLAELLRPDVFREEMWGIGPVVRPIVFFDLVGDTIWGATGAMLRQLLGLVTGTLGRGQLGHD